MSITEAQKKAIYKYRESLDEIRCTAPKGYKDIIRTHAEAHGESVSAFVKRALDETMERDNKTN